MKVNIQNTEMNLTLYSVRFIMIILGLYEEKAEENDTFVTQTYLSVAFITFTSSPPPYLDRVVSTR